MVFSYSYRVVHHNQIRTFSSPPEETLSPWAVTPCLHCSQEQLCLRHKCCCLVTQSCSDLCDPMGCSPPGSSVRGILPARIPEPVAISSFRGSSRAKHWIHISCLEVVCPYLLYKNRCFPPYIRCQKFHREIVARLWQLQEPPPLVFSSFPALIFPNFLTYFCLSLQI